MATQRKFVFNDKAKQAFLAYLEKHGTPNKAAKAIGTTFHRVRSELDQSKEFQEAYDESMLLFRESIEEEVFRRGMEGVEEDIYYQGLKVGTKVNYSDTMLSLLVKTKNPEYGEKIKVDTTIHGGVLLTLPVAPNTQQWLDGTTPRQLPPAEDEDQEDANVIDVTAESELEPVPV